MTDPKEPFQPNTDESTIADPATGMSIGHNDKHVVVCLKQEGGKQTAVFMDQDLALNFLGQFMREVREKGWMQ